MFCCINWSDPSIIAAFISGAFAIISGIATIVFFSKKKGIENKFDKDLESHKNWLERKNIEIQGKLDTKLELIRVEYSVLYRRRLEVVEEIHNRLLVFDKTFNIIANYKDSQNINETDRQLVLDLQKNYKEFSEFFEKKKIYISEELSTGISRFINLQLFEMVTKLPKEFVATYFEQYKKDNNIPNSALPDIEELIGKFTSMFEEMEKDKFRLSGLLSYLQNEFRTLIGAEINSNR